MEVMNKNPYGYVFGYGSIINLRSRVRSGGSAKAMYVRISEKFNFRRKWNFRSLTGFTALGLSKVTKNESPSTVNGVLFACSLEQMKSFDMELQNKKATAIEKKAKWRKSLQ